MSKNIVGLNIDGDCIDGDSITISIKNNKAIISNFNGYEYEYEIKQIENAKIYFKLCK